MKARKGGRMEVRSIVYRVHGVIGFMELIEFMELTLKTLQLFKLSQVNLHNA